MRYRILPLLLLPGLWACVEPPSAPGASPPSPIAGLVAQSRDGVEFAFDRVPWNPRFVVDVPRGLDPAGDTVALLSGPVDTPLLEDLRRAPFGAAQLARAVPIDLRGDPRRIEILPRAPLEPGGVYSLVIAGWARDLREAWLWDDRRGLASELRVSSAPDAGGRLLGFWPADTSSGVASNLAFVAARFEGTLLDAASALRIEDALGQPLPGRSREVRCSELDLPGHSCLLVEPYAPLDPSRDYRIVVDEALRDIGGAPLGPLSARFRTAEADHQPPRWVAHPCEPDASAVPVGCALIDDESIALEVALDEPAQLILLADAQPPLLSLAHDRVARFRLDGLAPDQALALSLFARDAAGNESVTEFVLQTSSPLPTLSITEVRADPRGAEPAQEYVELWNFGAEPLDLLGYSLSDDPQLEGSVIEQSWLLHPGARALLVARDFDAGAPQDVQPPEGTALVRTGNALGRAGLSNAGEALLLRDPSGRRISAVPARPAPRPGVCVVRVSDSLRDGSDGSFALDEEGTCTPGL